MEADFLFLLGGREEELDEDDDLLFLQLPCDLVAFSDSSYVGRLGLPFAGASTRAVCGHSRTANSRISGLGFIRHTVPSLKRCSANGRGRAPIARRGWLTAWSTAVAGGVC